MNPKRTNTAAWNEKQERWIIKVQRDCERKSFYSSTPGRTGQREANAKADRWLDSGVSDVSTRVSRLLDEWLAEKRATTSRSNWSPLENHVKRWIAPKIGMRNIGSLRDTDMQEVVNNAYNKGHLAKKTLKNIRGALSNFLKYCRIRGYTDIRGEDITIPTSAAPTSKRCLTPDELTMLFKSDETTFRGKPVADKNIYFYRFLVLTGLRPGEALGLLQENIRQDGRITISRSINRYGEETYGKNDNARRVFKMSPMSAALLQKQLAQSDRISEYVFPSESGTAMRLETIEKAWKRYREHNGIGVTLYELRHTFVSVNKEMPEGLKRLVVGHSQSMDTEGHYGHEMQGDMDAAAEHIESAFSLLLEK